jgi:hypothetical protein
LLKIAEYVLRKRIVKVVWNDESSGRQTKRTRPTDVVDRPNLSHRTITLRENQRFTFEHSVKYSFRIPLHVFDADIHVVEESTKEA